MGMSEVGAAWVSIVPSARGFGSKLNSEIGGDLDSAGKSAGSRFGNALKVGALAAVGGALLATKFLKGAVDEAREAQVVTARTENVIKSMGLASKVSANQIADLAGAISAKTGIDDEAIQSGQNLLLTFRNVAKDAGVAGGVFEQTSRLMVDLSAAMGTDAKGAAIQLGKALNDPIKGISALTRVGVSFSEQQKEQIEGFVESGNLAKAQGIILGELKNQFGGAAEAMATPADKARVAYANLKEQIGTALLPVIDKLLRAFTGAMPAVSRALAGIGPAFGQMVAFVAPFVAKIRESVPAAVAFGQSLLASVIPAVQNLVTAFRPIVTDILNALPTGLSVATTLFGSFGSVLVSVTGFLADHSDAVGGVVVAVVAMVAAYKAYRAVVVVATAVQTAFNAALLMNPVGAVVLALVGLAAAAVYAYKKSETFRGIVDQVWAALKTAGVWIADTAKKASAFASVLAGVVVSGVRAVIGIVGNIIGKLADFGGAIRDRVEDAARFVAGVKEKFGDALAYIKGIPGKITAALGNLGSLLYNAGISLLAGLIEGVRSKIDDLQGLLQSVTDKIPDWKGPADKDRVLLYAAGGLIMQGLIDGMSDHLPKLHDMLTAVGDDIRARVDQIKSDMSSLAGSVSSAFTGNLFEATTGADFVSNLTVVKGSLKKLSAAFKKLVKWGLPAKFLSQLFSSGNGALILDLASGSKSTAFDAFQTFGQVQNLSNSLGGAVAKNQYGDELRKQTNRLERVEKAIKHVGDDVARALNHMAAKAQRSAT